MKIKAYVTLEVFDRNGRRVFRRKHVSHSFLQAFLVQLRILAQVADETNSYADTGGTARVIKYTAELFYMVCAAGVTTKGIVVGTGTNAVAVTDYALQTKIAHGVTSGTLSYSAQFFGGMSIADPNASFTLYRDFTNSFTSSITVNEEGIYVAALDTGSVDRYFCIIRDKEASGVVVAAGQNLRVTYTIQTST